MEKEKHLGLRIDAETHKKLKSLAEFEGRSINGEVLYLIRQAIMEFENKHGELKYKNLHIWIQEKPVRLYGTGKFYLARKLLCISSGIL